MRLLLIEDEADLRAGLSRSLRDEGYAVDEAPNGQEGLYKALNTEYDAIILDLLIPVLNGWDVLQKIRTSARSTPVLILTACDQTADRVRGLDAGADDYLIKPFDIEELLARVRALIRRGTHAPCTRLEWNGISIDTAARKVLQNGLSVDLTPREFALLEYLAVHRGTVLSRTQLYEHLFDEKEDTLSNLLEVHISHIRKKLGADVIMTRRGAGYGIGL